MVVGIGSYMDSGIDLYCYSCCLASSHTEEMTMYNIPPDEDREMQRQEMHNEAVDAQVDTLAEGMRNDMNELISAFMDSCEDFAVVYCNHKGDLLDLGECIDRLMKEKLNDAARIALDL